VFGQCLSANVGGQPLNSPTRHCLGGLLLHQQADRKRADPLPQKLYRENTDYQTLACLSAGYF